MAEAKERSQTRLRCRTLPGAAPALGIRHNLIDQRSALVERPIVDVAAVVKYSPTGANRRARARKDADQTAYRWSDYHGLRTGGCRSSNRGAGDCASCIGPPTPIVVTASVIRTAVNIDVRISVNVYVGIPIDVRVPIHVGVAVDVGAPVKT